MEEPLAGAMPTASIARGMTFARPGVQAAGRVELGAAWVLRGCCARPAFRSDHGHGSRPGRARRTEGPSRFRRVEIPCPACFGLRQPGACSRWTRAAAASKVASPALSRCASGFPRIVVSVDNIPQLWRMPGRADSPSAKSLLPSLRTRGTAPAGCFPRAEGVSPGAAGIGRSGREPRAAAERQRPSSGRLRAGGSGSDDGRAA